MAVTERMRSYTPRRMATVRLRARKSARRLDWVLLGTAVVLSIIGALLVWSATRARTAINAGDPQFFFKRHLLNLAVGLVLCVLATLVDYRKLRAYVFALYLACLAGLLIVLSPAGSTINGAHSWIVIGSGFSVQPSEFAKIGIIATMALLLSENYDAFHESGPRHRDVCYALLAAAAPIAIILLLPDLGTTMVISVIVAGLLVIAGISGRWLAGLALLGTLGVAAVIKLELLHQYQLNRFAAFVNPALDPQGVGYNTAQARLAIGSGGLLGKGLFGGLQTNGQFVPEQHTDFIFTVAGEELGFVGGGMIILLFLLLLWRACRIAMRAQTLFGVLLAAGVVCWFGFQAFENIGMTLGIMPVAGVPLPFLSYGGSSMFANFLAIGLLENVHLHALRNR
jgi:rod shape determining protein RodA